MIRPSRTLILCLASSATLLGAADDSAIPTAGRGNAPDLTASGASKQMHSWELPPITVEARRDADLKDDDLVGTYGQPRWSTTRRFSEVRTYVIPEGQIEFEYWLFWTEPSRQEKKDAADAGAPKPKPAVKQQYEVEMGLGNRLQLDLYQVYVKDGNNGNNALDATKFELRYALADWDRIWGNPTLYGEWEQAAEGADSAEFKLLLCGDLSSHWAWGTNLVWEQKTGDNRDRSQEWNSAIAYNAIDQKLSLGAETAFAYVSELEDPSGGDRLHHWELMAGPSIRFYPIPQFHVILSELIGLNHDAPESKTALIAGWEF